jgi:ATP-dependent DNA helicase DinG
VPWASIDLQLDSSFDFDNNMIVYVVKDMPEPNDKSYLSKLEHLLVETHRAQQGSMLTLFTNRREMEKCYDAVKPELSKDDLRLVCQKWGVSVKGLRDDFIKDEHLSLFALKSFWEGFDAPGATLKGVIIPKLPFNRPTDPLSRERALHDRGAWGHYVLPKAVIETKQAAGRLIRSSEDTGILILADKRILSKGYGKKFLNSLQSKTVRVRTIDEIVEEIADGRACARK